MENETAKKEPPVAAKDLLEEIMPLLSDYFEGYIKLENYGIAYGMPNGQKFIFKAEEAV
ncbi:MAG: hypothetical protein K2N68_04545 [Clostridia bacterium]|nr:hypothetical protein [Clostridia bacterium]